MGLLYKAIGNLVMKKLKNNFAMKKLFVFIIAAASVAVSCSKTNTIEQPAPFWKATVTLVPSVESKTSLDETAKLNWTAGDAVSYWTSSDGVSYGVSASAEVVDGKFTATIPSGHSHIKVVYPAVADGSEYAVPVVKKFQNYPTAGAFDGKNLPMLAEKDDVAEGSVSLNVNYTVLGAVLRFKVSGSGSVKAVKAGDYQADFLTPAVLSATPVDAFVVVPVGDVTYTPKAFVIATDGSYREYTRSVVKESNLKAKAYEIAMSLDDAGKYSYTAGWKKASDIGLSVAWADMSYGGTKPSDYPMKGWTDTNDWGEGWRLPSQSEAIELENLDPVSCKAMGTMDGINGLFVTNNGASIFLPIGGYYNAYRDGVYNAERGQYWTDIYYGTSKRWGDPYPCHFVLTFSNENNLSHSIFGFDMDSCPIRLVRPLN